MAADSSNSRKDLYIRLLLRFILFAFSLIILYFIVPKLFSLLSPFIFAYILAFLLNPLVKTLNKKLRIPRQILTFLLVLVIIFGLFTLIAWFLYTVLNQAVSLAMNFQSVWEHILSALNYLDERLDWLLSFLPHDTEVLLDNLTNGIFTCLQTISKDFLDFVISHSASITSTVGVSFLNVAIFIMAAYFLTAEYESIHEVIRKHSSNRVYYYYEILKDAVKSALGGYFKAQFLLALLAFIIMFLALVIYGQEYAILLALFLAVLDFIPIIGTGVFLVPWGILEIIGGDLGKGIFLIILCFAFFVIRRFVEPKIVGRQTGLPPLIALLSIYLGMKLAGIFGAIIGPVAAMIIISIVKSHIFDHTVKDIKDMADDISHLLKHRENE